MRRAKPGFTLIELLMVILVIGLLIVMLVPAISAAKKAVRTSMTQNRIWEIDSAIGRYKDTFGDYPPSGLPRGAAWHYPKGWVPPDPSAEAAGTGYGDFDVNKDYAAAHVGVPPGGQYLTYFLFGPTRFGWTVKEHAVSINWTPPSGLDRYLTKRPLRNIGHMSHYYYVTPPYWFFEDAFGLTGNRFAGAILYLRADTRARTFQDISVSALSNAQTTGRIVGNEPSPKDTTAIRPRYIYSHISAQYYWSCRGSGGDYDYYTGDGQQDDGKNAQRNLARLVKQCPKGFVLLSAGADHSFGYRTKNSHVANQKREGADWDDGASDDITNFVHD